MGNRNNRRKYKDIEIKNKTNERITKYNAIKKLVREHKLSKALTDVERYIDEYPTDCFGYSLYGMILINLNQLDKAKIAFTKLVHEEARNMYTAMYYLAGIERKQGNKEKAKELFRQTIEESPYEEDFARLELAEMEEDDANFEEAEKILDSISNEHIEYVKLEKVKIRLHTNKIVEAFNIISTIRENDSPKFNRKLKLEKGRIELAFNNCKYAKKYLEEALEGPKNRTYWLVLAEMAKLEVKLGKYDEAIIKCSNLLGKNDNLDNEVYLILGNAYESKKDYDLARNYYLKVIQHENIRKSEKGKFCLGQLEFRNKNYDTAIEYFKQIQTGTIYKRGAMFSMVHIEIRRGNFQQASIYLEKILTEGLIKDTEMDEYRRLRVFIDKNLGIEFSITNYTSYGEKQYAQYSLEEAIKHIKQEHFNNNLKYKSNFNNNICIEDLLEEIIPKLTEENLYTMELADIYYIDYPNVGYTEGGDLANSIRVVTLPGTKDIITLYPDIKNINIRSEEIEKPKQKRLSQIEKFNKKYNLK